MKTDGRVILVHCCLLGIEACGLYLILDLFNIKTVDNALSVIGLLTLYPISFIVNKLLYRIRWWSFFLFVLSWLMWAIAFLLMIKFQLYAATPFSNTEWLTAFPSAVGQLLVTFKPEILIFLASILLWWTGKRIAAQDNTYGAAITEFQFWLFIIVIILLSASGFQTELHNAILTVLIFFFFSLTGISIAHTLESRSWREGLPSQHWATMLLASIIIVLIIGIAIASLFTPNLLHLIVGWLLWILSIIWDIVMRVLKWIATLIPPPDHGQILPPTTGPGLNPPEEKSFFEIPENIRTILQVLWMTLMIGLFTAALWSIAKQIFDRMRRGSTTKGAKTKQLRGGLKQDLINMFRSLWRFISSLFKQRSSASRAGAENPGVALTRQIYRNVLRWAARHHYARKSAQTPQEFYEALAPLIPDAQAELALITRQYIDVRYGLSAPATEQQEQLHRSWLIIKKIRLRAPKAANQEVNNNG